MNILFVSFFKIALFLLSTWEPMLLHIFECLIGLKPFFGYKSTLKCHLFGIKTFVVIYKLFLVVSQQSSATIPAATPRDAGKGAQEGGARPPYPFSRGEGGQKCPFIKYTCLIKNEQALAEVIICVNAERGVTARSEILRLQA